MDSSDLLLSPQSSITSLTSCSTTSSFKPYVSSSPTNIAYSSYTTPLSDNNDYDYDEPLDQPFSYKLPTSFFQWSVSEDEYDEQPIQQQQVDTLECSLSSEGENSSTSFQNGITGPKQTVSNALTFKSYSDDIGNYYNNNSQGSSIKGSGFGISCDKLVLEELMKTKPRRRRFISSTSSSSSDYYRPYSVKYPRESSHEIFMRRQKKKKQMCMGRGLGCGKNDTKINDNGNTAGCSPYCSGICAEKHKEIAECGGTIATTAITEQEKEEEEDYHYQRNEYGRRVKKDSKALMPICEGVVDYDGDDNDSHCQEIIKYMSRLRLGNKRRKTHYSRLMVNSDGIPSPGNNNKECLQKDEGSENDDLEMKDCVDNILNPSHENNQDDDNDDDDGQSSSSLVGLNISALASNAAMLIQFSKIKNESDSEDSDVELEQHQYQHHHPFSSVGNTYFIDHSGVDQKSSCFINTLGSEPANTVNNPTVRPTATFSDVYNISTSSILDHSEPDTITTSCSSSSSNSLRLPLSRQPSTQMSTGTLGANLSVSKSQPSFYDQGEYVEKFVGFKIRSTMFPKSSIALGHE